MAIASMVLGIVSIVLSCVWYLSIVAGVVGIVLAVVLIIAAAGIIAAIGLSDLAELSNY